jgi:uncharacterized protein
MSSHSAYPIVQLAITPKSLGKIDILAPVSYKGEGFLSLTDFARLQLEASHLDAQDGFYCELRTHHQDGGMPVMEISLKGQMQLACQRCLQPLIFEFSQKKRFVFVKTEEEADDFPMDNDAEEAMVASHSFDLLEAIEDEILLAIPNAPKHSIEDCQISQEGGSTEPQNPFKVLKSLKK